MSELLKRLKSQGSEHVFFVAATILSSGIHFIYSIYVKAYVQPLEYGMYSTCMLLQTYMAYLQLGSLNAFNRDYPQLVGAGKHEEAKKYRDTVFSFLLSVYMLALIVTVVGMVVFSNLQHIDNRLVFGFVLTSVLTTVTIVENYGNYRTRIDKGFKCSSVVTLLELCSIPLGLILIPKLGYYAIYITAIAAMLIGIIFYFKPSYKDFKYTIDKDILKMALISGMPLLINGLIWTVVNSIDKFVILGFIDTEALGVYGIAQNAFSFMVLIPSAMSQLFYAKMGKEYGASGDVQLLNDTSLKFSSVLAAVTSLIALFGFYFLPILVDVFMPSYGNGVPSSQILIVGLSIYAATLVNGNILTILKRNKELLQSSVCMCVFNGICSVGYVWLLGAKIECVALGTATAYIFCTFIIIYQVYRSSDCTIGSQIKASVLPVVISLAPGVIIYQIMESRIVDFFVSVLIVVVFYWIFYRKQFLKVIGR